MARLKRFTVKLMVWLTPELLSALDAKRGTLSRQDAIRAAIEGWLGR